MLKGKSSVIRMHWRLLYCILLFVAPSSLYAQGKTLESIKIGYSGIGITHDLLKMMGSNRRRRRLLTWVVSSMQPKRPIKPLSPKFAWL